MFCLLPALHSGVDIGPPVGRRVELERLTAAVAERRGAVIVGAAGVGKTTVAKQVLESAAARGMAVATVSATRASKSLPFGALAPLLPPYRAGERPGQADQGQLLGSYARAIVERADGRAMVVLVDEANFLDDGSATLVQQLAQSGSVTVLATVRTGESVPDPVVALWKDGPAERVEIAPLGPDAIEELVTAWLGEPIEAASLHQFVQRCQGNPMVLRELLAGARETGALTADRGIWRLSGPLRPTSRLVELVALRLRELSDEQRGVLELLALGEPLGLAVALRLADADSVESVERTGLITSRRDGRRVQLELAHPVYEDVVRVGISPLRERSLSRSLAEAIEATRARRREDVMLIASLRLAGGGGDVALLVEGAFAARARNDHALAERLARAAIDKGGGFEPRLLAAELAHLQGRSEQAEKELAALCLDAVTDSERARVAIARFDNAYLAHARVDLDIVDDAMATVSDPSWRDELWARRFYVTSLASGPRATLEEAWTLLGRATPGPLAAVHLIAYSLARLGRLREANEFLDSVCARDEMPSADQGWESWALFIDRARILVYEGRLAVAERLLEDAYARLLAQPATEARGYVAGVLARVYLEQGRPRSAYLHATEARALLARLGRVQPARWRSAAAAEALALLGESEAAAELLHTDEVPELPEALMSESYLLHATAWTSVAAGDLPEARRQLEAAAALGEEVGDLVGAAAALHGLARLGRARQVAPRLSALADSVEGESVAVRAAYARAVASRDALALESASAAFEEMGAMLFAAEASAEAAVLLRKQGSSRRAAAAGQSAARLLEHCEGATTPQVHTVSARVRLTPAELDAALQAAAGLSNKEIAAKMTLSVRTVESNLQRVYEKLGIGGRRELSGALRDLPAPEPVQRRQAQSRPIR